MYVCQHCPSLIVTVFPLCPRRQGHIRILYAKYEEPGQPALMCLKSYVISFWNVEWLSNSVLFVFCICFLLCNPNWFVSELTLCFCVGKWFWQQIKLHAYRKDCCLFFFIFWNEILCSSQRSLLSFLLLVLWVGKHLRESSYESWESVESLI